MRILVADSNPVVRRALAGLLAGLGQVEEAGDGRRARRRMRQDGVDLLVCDVEMPGMRVLDVLPFLSAPVVVVSARTDPETLAACWKAGVDGFVARPFNPEDVLHVVAHVLGHAHRSPRRALSGSRLRRVGRVA